MNRKNDAGAKQDVGKFMRPYQKPNDMNPCHERRKNNGYSENWHLSIPKFVQ